MSVDLDGLLGNLSLDREHQMRAVRAALRMLLVDGRRGVVLADEVGCGKTFEALGAAALLWKHFSESATPIQRILIVAEPALITKWFTEIEAPADAEKGGKGRGFPQYVQGEKWKGFQTLLRNACRLRSPRDGDERGVREDGRIQVQPNRIYIAKPALLTGEREGSASPTVRWLRRTSWDLVIVDEAHHYARLHTKASRVFFPEQTPESREQGLRARFLLALTATPFQLSTSELLNLLRVVEASPEDVDVLSRALPKYERALESFYAHRRFPPGDEARERWVQRLDSLRTEHALGGDGPKSIPGLQDLLRRYIIRNVKDAGLRDYGLAEKRETEIGCRTFAKLDDLKPLVQKSPLIPLEGEHAFVYLSLRDLVDDAAHAAREDENERPTFISGDLRQCLSSYSQLRASSLVQKKLKRAGDVVRALDKLAEAKLEHPKVEALCRVVDSLLLEEMEEIRANPRRMFHKIVVFNTLLKTARELREALERTAAARIEPFVDEMLSSVGWTREGAEESIRAALEAERASALHHLRETFKNEDWLRVDRDLVRGTPIDMRAESRLITDVMFDRAKAHCTQPLFLLRFALWMRGTGQTADEHVAQDFLGLRVGQPLTKSMERIVDHYLDSTPLDPLASEEENRDRARRELARIANILGSPEYVGRFDGDTPEGDRELRRENFNRPYAPLVLLVSRVGEEGIDLQQHTRYVLHYDVEWNPAKMEQREGRVDREGRRSGGAVQVQFFLLKDTYEERVFHTVMERDAWFQVLIGSKRQELGRSVEAEVNEAAPIDLATDGGRLTFAEATRVIVNLQP